MVVFIMVFDKNKGSIRKKNYRTKEQKKSRSEISKALWKDPEFRKKVIEKSIKTKNTPEYKILAREWQINNWKNPIYRNNILSKTKITKNRASFRLAASNKRKEMWKDPIYRNNVVTGITNSARTPARRKQSSDISIKLWKDPNSKLNSIEANEKRRLLAIAQWKDPVIRAKCIDAIRKGKQNPNAIAHMKQVLNTPEYKELRRQQRLHQVFPKKDSLIERMIQDELTKRDILFKKHALLIGQPDIFIEPNICIFADGGYVHGDLRERGYNDLTMNGMTVYERHLYDWNITRKLIEQNYFVLRFWEQDIIKDVSSIVDQIERLIKN